jgi:hypothetical protein
MRAGVIIAIVVNVQQGLPATLNSCLSIASSRMAKHNVLVRRSDIVETLGAVTVICSDKTGTLTQNKLTVEHLWVDGVTHVAARNVSPGGPDANPRVVLSNAWASLSPVMRLLMIAGICNTASFGERTQTAVNVGDNGEAGEAGGLMKRVLSFRLAAASSAAVTPDAGGDAAGTPHESAAGTLMRRVMSFRQAPPAPAPSGAPMGNSLDCALLTYVDSLYSAQTLRDALPTVRALACDVRQDPCCARGRVADVGVRLDTDL